MPALRVNAVAAGYGALTVVHAIDFAVDEGEVLAILGANGVGKSTLLRTIAGLLPVKAGSIQFGDQDVTKFGAPRRVREGIALVPEGRMLFPSLSVYDHLWLGTNPKRAAEAELKRRLAFVFDLFPALKPRVAAPASTLSGGQQQMLAIARALMSVPRVLLLDEPSMGVAPKLREEIYRALRQLIESTRLTVIVVEQDGPLALAIAHRVAVMQGGRFVREAAARDIASLDSLADLYLGRAA